MGPKPDVAMAEPCADAEFERVLSHITHDVRACLRAMRTLPDWILEDIARAGIALPPSSVEMFDMLVTQTRRCDRMLGDLRRYARVGQGAGPMGWHVIAPLVEEAVARVGVPAAFDLACRFEVDHVYGGAEELVALLEALLTNAVRHHDRGAGRIEVRAVNSADGVWLTVSDDGPGIAPDCHDRVFELLTTLKPRDEIEGSGVGLALVRRIAGLTGGQARIGNGSGTRGTVLECLLPPMAEGPRAHRQAG